MSAEAPKPVDPNPTADSEEKQAEAEEDLEKREFATWIPYIASKGIESQQILYTLAKKKDTGVEAPPVAIPHPYFVAVLGSDLYKGFADEGTPLPAEFTKEGVYFISMAELASCSGKLHVGVNKPTSIKENGSYANKTELEIYDSEGTFMKLTIGFTRGAYKKFEDMSANAWNIAASADEQTSSIKTGNLRSIFCGPSAGFQPVDPTAGSEGRKALDAYLTAEAKIGKYTNDFLYKLGDPLDTSPATKFTWFKRVTVRSRYPNADTLAKETGLYVRLNMQDFRLSTLDVGYGSKNPHRCYIEKEHFKSIWSRTSLDGEIVGVQKKRGADGEVVKPGARRSWEIEIGEDDVPANDIVPEIYFRDELGKVWAKRPSDGQKVSNFMYYYEKGTTRPDYGRGRFPRAVDTGMLKIHIHQLINDEERYGGTADEPRDKLSEIFRRARSGGNMKTEYDFFKKDTKTEDIDATQFTLLSRSCFGDYDTYIANELLSQYLASDVTIDRQVPKDIDTDIIAKLQVKYAKGINKLCEFNKVEGKDEYTSHISRETRITAAKIDGAYGTRESAINQGTVMEGISATDVANALGWSPMRATSIRGWEKERFAMAEWLHRCGYAYGGLTDNDPGSSQKKENLIFGSSETNSIMTRYEDVYRNAIIRERTLTEELKVIYSKAEMSSASTEYVNGRLGTALTDKGGKLQFKDKTWKREIIPVPKAKAVPAAANWVDIGKRYPWLCSELTYKFFLDKESKMFKNDLQWTTHFFPFDRLFFTRLEAVVDDNICLKLWQLAIFDAKTTVDRILGETGARRIIKIKKKGKPEEGSEEKKKEVKEEENPEDKMDEGE